MNLRTLWLLPALMTPAVAMADPPDFDRPGAGFATTTVPAWSLAWEQGLPTYQRERPGGVLHGTYTADSLFRLGLGGPLELQLGGSAWNRFEQEDVGRRQHHLGHGDSSVGLKFAPGGSADADDFSWAALAKITYANGDRDLSNDARQYSLGTTMQWKPDDIHQNTLYVNLDRLGRQNTWTVAPTFGRRFGDHWSAYLEADLIHDGNEGNEVQAGGGVAWDIGEHLQLDAYALHRIGSHGPSLIAGLGVSVFFGRSN